MPGGRLRKVKSAPIVNLKVLADYLGLTPGTISVVLNRVPRASEIPQETQKRIFAAAAKVNYRPSHTARSLKSKHTRTIGILAPEVSEGYGALLLNAIGEYLVPQKYFYFLATHRRRQDLLEEYLKVMAERSVEGLILIGTVLDKPLPLPAVAIFGHKELSDLANISVDHDCAAMLALGHLIQLGHTRIAFMRGQSFSSDAEDRWRAIQQAALRLHIKILPELIIHLTMDTFSPLVGYPVMHHFLKTNKTFTALFAYNDFSAIGAIRALRETGLRVPEDISVIGFDDINSAAFQNPSLTTIRQPWKRIAETAVKTLLDRLKGVPLPAEVLVEPELVIRESTRHACALQPRNRRLGAIKI